MSRIKPTVVNVSARATNLLRRELSKRQIENHYQLRFQIILLSSEGKTNPEISEILNTSLPTVRRWRLRWAEKSDSLISLESDHRHIKNTDLILLREIKLVLSDSARSGSSCRISEEEKVRLQALACQHPSDFGLPFSAWTHIELSKQANKMGIKISSSHYGRVLKKRFTTP
jgi:transposase